MHGTSFYRLECLTPLLYKGTYVQHSNRPGEVPGSQPPCMPGHGLIGLRVEQQHGLMGVES